MSAKHHVAFCLAVLMLPVLPTASGAGAQQAHTPDRTVGLGDAASTPQVSPPQSKLWPAPVGHRQPRAADLPANLKTAADAERLRRERALDRKLQICRVC